MTIIFHGPDNDHAPFPHRIVIVEESTAYLTVPGTRVKRKVTRDRQEFVICSFCDHWILRNILTCGCPYQCHELGKLLAELAGNDVESEGGTQEPDIREAES